MKNNIKGITGAGDIVRSIYRNLKPYTYAGLLCFNRKKIDHNIIINFIKDANDGKIISKGHYGKRETDFGYGIDEIFLNDVLIKHIGKINTIIDYQISYFLFHSLNFIYDKAYRKNTDSILNTILGPYSNRNMSIKDKLTFIDKNTYQIRQKTKINDELCRRFTKLIEYLIDSKKLWLEENIQNFIYKYLRHIISANLVIHSDYKLGITTVDAFDAVYDSEYTKM